MKSKEGYTDYPNIRLRQNRSEKMNKQDDFEKKLIDEFKKHYGLHPFDSSGRSFREYQKFLISKLRSAELNIEGWRDCNNKLQKHAQYYSERMHKAEKKNKGLRETIKTMSESIMPYKDKLGKVEDLCGRSCTVCKDKDCAYCTITELQSILK